MTGHDAFISYSSINQAVAQTLCRALEARGIRCWIAPRDVAAGMAYGEALLRAIETSRVFVLILSEGANRSPHVIREVERAVASGLPILPFKIEAVSLSKEMEYFISGRHWLDAVEPPVERHLEALVGSVEAILKLQPGPASLASRPATAQARRGAIAAALIALVCGLLLAGRVKAPAPADVKKAAAPAQASASPRTVALLALKVSGFPSDGPGEVFRTALEEQLLSSGKVKLVERRILDDLIKELKLGSSDLADPAVALKIGRVLSAGFVVTGSVTKLDDRAVASVRLIETETTRVVGMASGEGKAGALLPIAKRLARDLDSELTAR